MPRSDALRRDLDHIVVGLCSDAELAKRHHTTPETVRRERRAMSAEVRTARIRSLALEIAAELDWDGGLDALIEGVLAHHLNEVRG